MNLPGMTLQPVYREYVPGGGGGGGVVSYPDPDSHSCGWITSPLRGKRVWRTAVLNSVQSISIQFNYVAMNLINYRTEIVLYH